MSWRPEIEEIERRRRRALELGGAEAVERQRAKGLLTVRERIERLLDPGSFHETGPHAGGADYAEDGTTQTFDPANYVLGTGRIDSRPCVVGGEDFTQRGGSPTTAGFRKSVYAEELATRLRLPLVRFLEGGGGSVRGAAKGPGPRTGGGDPVFATHRFVSIAKALRTAPVVSAGLGAVAGLPAARLAASHLAIMTRRSTQVLIGGPALVERALGEKKTKEELGGAQVHGRSGVVDLVVESEEEVFGAIRRFLSYLPTRVGETAPRAPRDAEDGPGRRADELLEIVPRDRRRVYDMRQLLSLVFDLGSLFELAASYGRAEITALARLDGWPVGVFANDPTYQGGAMGAEEAQKVKRLIQLCQTFHLPILTFLDEPGFMIGSQAEAAGTIRYGVEAICAAVETTVPWATVHVRKAYGVASAAHFGPGAHVLAWPSAESGPLPIEGGVAVAFKREIAAAPDPERKRRELEEAFAKARSPFPRAESFSVHDLIDPRDTRPELCAWLELERPRVEREARRRSIE